MVTAAVAAAAALEYSMIRLFVISTAVCILWSPCDFYAYIIFPFFPNMYCCTCSSTGEKGRFRHWCDIHFPFFPQHVCAFDSTGREGRFQALSRPFPSPSTYALLNRREGAVSGTLSPPSGVAKTPPYHTVCTSRSSLGVGAPASLAPRCPCPARKAHDAASILHRILHSGIRPVVVLSQVEMLYIR